MMTDSETRLRVLYLEDEPNDVDLVQVTLAEDGIACDITWVETRDAFVAALERGGFDLILSDKSLPSFDGLSALALAREIRPEVPFIFVSGTLGEEAAIESLKHGATDYVLKQRLTRVVPITRRALRNAAERAERQQRERELEAIASMSAALRTAMTRAEMLPVVMEQVSALLKVDGAAVLRRDPVTSEAIVEMCSGVITSDRIGQRLPAGAGIVGQVMATGEPYLTNAAGHDSTWVWPQPLGSISALACVPLMVQNHTLGALWIGRTTPVTGSEVRVLGAIGDIAASALHRAALFDELETRVADRTRELTEANQRLQELDRLKDQFVSNVNHELRSPLTSIKLYLELLEVGKPEKREQYVKVLQREANRLQNLIEDMLNLARLDLQAVPLHLEPIDVQAMLEELVADRATLAAASGLTLTYARETEARLAFGDDQLLSQVATNLLANAINYTPRDGAVSVVVALSQRDDGEWLTFTVRDNGRGISAEDLPHLFERFYRGEVGRTSGAAGTGLGLAICHDIVERLGGQITVESAPEQGTTFTVWLRPAS
ncbi:MAG: response regulator [Chloroflexi bacterium]|nr:response regulator [Chloroflexota bacterium]